MDTFYFFENEDGLMCRCDIVLDHETLPSHSWVLWLFVKSDPSTPAWSTFVHALQERLRRELDAHFVAQVHQGEWIELYFYAPSPKGFEPLSQSLLHEHHLSAYEQGSYQDRKWHLYHDQLSPDELSRLQMFNRTTLQQLQEAGDVLPLEREVEHYLFFQTPTAQERAEYTLAQEGFVLSETFEHEDDTYRYGSVWRRTHALDAIESITLFLYEFALQEHAHYEGWSTALAQENDHAQ